MARAKSPASPRKRAPSRPAAPAPFAGDPAALVVMGRMAGAFGVRGWVKVKPFTEQPDGLGGFAEWVVKTRAGWRRLPLEGFEVHARGPVAKVAGCDDPEAADALRGAEVAVPREALGEAGEGTWYQVDLLGLEVVDEAGRSLGRVEGFVETGETPVMVVAGERQRLIPFVADYVKAVDREAGRITADWKADYDE